MGSYGCLELHNGGCRDNRAAKRCLERNDKRHQAKLVPGEIPIVPEEKVFYLERDEEVPREAGGPEYLLCKTLILKVVPAFNGMVPYIKSSPSLRFLYQSVKIFKLQLLMVSSKGKEICVAYNFCNLDIDLSLKHLGMYWRCTLCLAPLSLNASAVFSSFREVGSITFNICI